MPRDLLAQGQPQSRSPRDLLAQAQPLARLEEDFFGAGVIEPARAILSGAGRSIVGGIAGGLRTAFDPTATAAEEGAAIVESAQAGAFQPRTEAGMRGMQTLGDLAQAGIDIVNIPLSALGGLAELATGQGREQAKETVAAIQREGLGKTAGERIFEETGSPLAATIAEATPTALAEALGAKGALAGAKATGRAADVAKPAVTQAAKETAKKFTKQSPLKQRIGELIAAGTGDVETAAFKLSEPGKLLKSIGDEAPRVVADRAARETIKQGFDEGVIASIKGASKADNEAFRRMVDIAERTKKNKLFGIRNRPSDVAGDLLMDRVNVIQKSNSRAGKRLDKVAKDLKGKSVDVTPVSESFLDDLSDMGVTLDNNLDLDFKGSDIEGLAGPERAITSIVNRMKGPKIPDAFQAHKLKRFIDEQVTFGKNAEGLAGRAEGVLKKLRRNIDGMLDDNFPEYDRVNTIYSETIQALDSFQDVAGRKMNLTAESANKATGTLMRRLMGNAQSRVRLLDSIDDIENIAKKHGGFSDQLRITGKVAKGMDKDLLKQVLFADELDSVFGPAARTSLQGEFDSALRRSARAASSKAGAADTAVDVAGSVIEKARGINEEGAFKAIKDLLKQDNFKPKGAR